MRDSRLVANRLLLLAHENGKNLTPMQLLKMVYIAHGWMLGLHGLPLIRDRIEAWQYGPVIPDLYNNIKQYGGGPVLQTLECDEENLSDVEEDLLKQVYGIYGSFSGITLSSLTHKEGTPWDRIYIPGKRNILIPNDLIAEYYESLAKDSETNDSN